MERKVCKYNIYKRGETSAEIMSGLHAADASRAPWAALSYKIVRNRLLVYLYNQEVAQLPEFGGIGDLNDFLATFFNNLIGVLGL